MPEVIQLLQGMAEKGKKEKHEEQVRLVLTLFGQLGCVTAIFPCRFGDGSPGFQKESCEIFCKVTALVHRRFDTGR